MEESDEKESQAESAKIEISRKFTDSAQEVDAKSNFLFKSNGNEVFPAIVDKSKESKNEQAVNDEENKEYNEEEKENELVKSNDQNNCNEEIIDGFSFMAFETESSLKKVFDFRKHEYNMRNSHSEVKKTPKKQGNKSDLHRQKSSSSSSTTSSNGNTLNTLASDNVVPKNKKDKQRRSARPIINSGNSNSSFISNEDDITNDESSQTQSNLNESSMNTYESDVNKDVPFAENKPKETISNPSAIVKNELSSDTSSIKSSSNTQILNSKIENKSTAESSLSNIKKTSQSPVINLSPKSKHLSVESKCNSSKSNPDNVITQTEEATHRAAMESLAKLSNPFMQNLHASNVSTQNLLQNHFPFNPMFPNKNDPINLPVDSYNRFLTPDYSEKNKSTDAIQGPSQSNSVEMQQEILKSFMEINKHSDWDNSLNPHKPSVKTSSSPFVNNLHTNQPPELAFISNLLANDPSFNPSHLPPHLQQIFYASLHTKQFENTNRFDKNNSPLNQSNLLTNTSSDNKKHPQQISHHQRLHSPGFKNSPGDSQSNFNNQNNHLNIQKHSVPHQLPRLSSPARSQQQQYSINSLFNNNPSISDHQITSKENAYQHPYLQQKQQQQQIFNQNVNQQHTNSNNSNNNNSIQSKQKKHSSILSSPPYKSTSSSSLISNSKSSTCNSFNNKNLLNSESKSDAAHNSNNHKNSNNTSNFNSYNNSEANNNYHHSQTHHLLQNQQLIHQGGHNNSNIFKGFEQGNNNVNSPFKSQPHLNNKQIPTLNSHQHPRSDMFGAASSQTSASNVASTSSHRHLSPKSNLVNQKNPSPFNIAQMTGQAPHQNPLGFPPYGFDPANSLNPDLLRRELDSRFLQNLISPISSNSMFPPPMSFGQQQHNLRNSPFPMMQLNMQVPPQSKTPSDQSNHFHSNLKADKLSTSSSKNNENNAKLMNEQHQMMLMQHFLRNSLPGIPPPLPNMAPPQISPSQLPPMFQGMKKNSNRPSNPSTPISQQNTQSTRHQSVSSSKENNLHQGSFSANNLDNLSNKNNPSHLPPHMLPSFSPFNNKSLNSSSSSVINNTSPNKHSNSKSTSSSSGNQNGGKWCTAHVKIAHMIMSHQSQKHNYHQHQHQKNSQSVQPVTSVPSKHHSSSSSNNSIIFPSFKPSASSSNPSNVSKSKSQHQFSDYPVQTSFQSSTNSSKNSSKSTNQTTTSASTFYPPIQSPINSQSSPGLTPSPFGGLASLQAQSNKQPKYSHMEEKNYHKANDISHNNKSSKKTHHSSSMHHNSQQHESLKRSHHSNTSHSSEKSRQRSRSRSPISSSKSNHRVNQSLGPSHNHVMNMSKDNFMPPNHLATEAAITAYAQFMMADKQRQDMLRLTANSSNSKPGSSLPLMPPFSGMPNLPNMPIPPGLSSIPASHYPLNFPPLPYSNSNQQFQSQIPNMPLPPSAHSSSNSKSPILSPKSFQSKLIQSMPQNMNESDFLRMITASMQSHQAIPKNEIHSSQPSPSRSPAKKDQLFNQQGVNNHNHFLNQFFENMNNVNNKKDFDDYPRKHDNEEMQITKKKSNDDENDVYQPKKHLKTKHSHSVENLFDKDASQNTSKEKLSEAYQEATPKLDHSDTSINENNASEKELTVEKASAFKDEIIDSPNSDIKDSESLAKNEENDDFSESLPDLVKSEVVNTPLLDEDSKMKECKEADVDLHTEENTEESHEIPTVDKIKDENSIKSNDDVDRSKVNEEEIVEKAEADDLSNKNSLENRPELIDEINEDEKTPECNKPSGEQKT